MSLANRFTETYGLRHPFAAAGMAFVGMTPALAVAVSNAGGVGAFAVGLMPPEALRAAIRAIRDGTDDPFDVNFITGFTTDEHIAVCAQERVPVVSFHWGAPSSGWIETLHRAGTHVWEQVGTVADARRSAAAGVDAIVAQGWEAGGHNYGGLPTFALVPAVVDAGAPTMVLASGGIADGRGVAAALALGADAVWVGTRLVATHEGDAHPGYKQRLLAAEGADTERTAIFGPHLPEFNPMRVVANSVVEAFRGREAEVPADTSNEREVGTTVLGGEETTLRRFTFMVPTSATHGDLDEMPLLAGQGVGLVRDVAPAGEVVERMMAEAEDVLARLRP